MLLLLQPSTATAGFLTMMRTKWPPPPSFVRNLLGGRRHHHCLLHTFVAAPSNARGGSSLLMLLRYDQPNKSATMIHSRRSLRHKMGGSSSSHDDEHDDSKKDNHSSTDSTSSSSEEKKKKSSSKAGGDIKTPDQLFERYKEEMMQYVLENAVKVKGSEKMKWPDIKTPDQLFERYASKMLNEEAEKFVEQFNERYAHTGYKIELADARERKKMFIALVVGLYALAFLTYWFRPKNGILPEHKMIMEQPPITFDQLLDILSAGEVQMLYYYPGRNKVVATLQPGAQINGSPFGPGLQVALDDTFRFDPYKFPTRIRATEHQLGIDEREAVPIAMRNTAWLVVLTYLIGCFLLITYACRLGMREIAKRMQRVVPTGGGRTGKPWKHKEISSKEDGPSKE